MSWTFAYIMRSRLRSKRESLVDYVKHKIYYMYPITEEENYDELVRLTKKEFDLVLYDDRLFEFETKVIVLAKKECLSVTPVYIDELRRNLQTDAVTALAQRLSLAAQIAMTKMGVDIDEVDRDIEIRERLECALEQEIRHVLR